MFAPPQTLPSAPASMAGIRISSVPTMIVNSGRSALYLANLADVVQLAVTVFDADDVRDVRQTLARSRRVNS